MAHLLYLFHDHWLRNSFAVLSPLRYSTPFRAFVKSKSIDETLPVGMLIVRLMKSSGLTNVLSFALSMVWNMATAALMGLLVLTGWFSLSAYRRSPNVGQAGSSSLSQIQIG